MNVPVSVQSKCEWTDQMHTYEDDIINMDNDAVRFAENRHLGCVIYSKNTR